MIWALKNTEVKGIIANMGGDDSYRVIPYVDLNLIHDNPKVFMGYSDIASWTTCFAVAGVVSYYGPNVLTPIAQPSSLADYTCVFDLWMNTPGMGLNDIDDSRQGIDKYLRRNPETCFVAEKGNMIIGVILCEDDGRRGYIHHTAVSVLERKNGVGTALVDAAVNALKYEGINKVALVVFSKNELGNYFWKIEALQSEKI